MNKDKKVVITYILLRISVILVMVAQFFNQNYYNVFLCLLALMLFTLPSIADRGFHIKLPSALEIVIMLFIYSAVILGEIKEYYVNLPHWDTMLHTLNGFLMAAIGFSLIDILNRSNKFHMELSPAFVALVAFCFSMTVGVMWEFFEFGVDNILRLDMQKDTFLSSISSVALNSEGANSPVIIKIKDVIIEGLNGERVVLDKYLDVGIYDTMKDLIVNFVGAVVFSVIGYLGIKNRYREKKFMMNFVPQMKDEYEIAQDDEANKKIILKLKHKK